MNREIKFNTKTLSRDILLTIILIIILSIITACTSKKGFVDIKKPVPLWQVLQHRIPGAGWVEHEDKRFKYFAGLVYNDRGERFVNEIFVPLCPLKEVKYTVTDKESEEFVSTSFLIQKSLNVLYKSKDFFLKV